MFNYLRPAAVKATRKRHKKAFMLVSLTQTEFTKPTEFYIVKDSNLLNLIHYLIAILHWVKIKPRNSDVKS